MKCAMIIVFVYLFSLISFTSLEAKTTAQPRYLFILSAQAATVEIDHGKTQLVMKNIDPFILWFTDRPIRQAGFTPVKKFIANWHTAFAEVPPNAGMVYLNMKKDKIGAPQPVAVELRHPHWKNKQLIFSIKFLTEKVNLSQGKTLRHVHLFIDPPAARLTDFHECPMEAVLG